MSRYIIKRILWMIPVILLVAFTIFTILYFVPGDPTALLLGNGATQAQKEALREQLGLNDSYLVRLGRFFKETFLEFDLGTSYQYKTSVSKELMTWLSITFQLTLLTFLFEALIGIPMGVTAAVHQNTIVDRVCTVISVIGASLPNFWLALMLVIVFSVNLNVLPSHGVTTWTGWILPVAAGCVMDMGGIARQTRSQMLEVINSDFITTARSKGLPENTIRYRHALPNAILPVVTTLGTRFGRALGGTVVIETVFSIPGVGTYLNDAISARDYPVICGSVVVLSILLCVIVLLTDLAYALIDPRIKAEYEKSGKRKRKVKEADA
ncbi:MAG: ABC transporter permease [Lachnospiraceae bacterium]|nr:ABC transporter permease [Lachnospiraceae bacterium]